MAEMQGVEDLGFDFVSCIGHFLGRDEDIFTLFEGGNNPIVFGRPLNHGPPSPAPPTGLPISPALGAPGMPPGSAGIDRRLYPHDEAPEGDSSANSSTANLAAMSDQRAALKVSMGETRADRLRRAFSH